MITEETLQKAGTLVLCADGTFSNAGERQGACSHHGGIAGAVRAARPALQDEGAASALAVAGRAVGASLRVRVPEPRTRNLVLLFGMAAATGAASAYFDRREQPQQHQAA